MYQRPPQAASCGSRPWQARADLALLAGLPALATDIDGKWLATVDGGPAGPVELTFDLEAEGAKLAGNLSMAMMPAPIPI
jgi:hypothetical protein